VTPACHQRGRKITPRASAKRLSSAQPAARTYQLCCHLRYTPVSPMMWRGVLGVPDMRHSWRPPAGGRWQGSDERRQLGLSRRGHCWPTRRDPMSFASAARAAFALISVVTMINVGRGGESRPRGDGFSAHAPPAHADGLPLRCQETRAGTATSAAAGPDQGRQRRLVGVHGVAEAVAQGLVPAPHAARIRRTPDVPRRAVPYTGGDGRALAIVSSPTPSYPPSPAPSSRARRPPMPGAAPLHSGSPRATRSARSKCCTV